ncbi:MAG: hypothetical protein SFY80_17155 [Verrucomicrobiota bacterium]|nr:hypothetical protein [Verrucomicrobiota bacterium]
MKPLINSIKRVESRPRAGNEPVVTVPQENYPAQPSQTTQGHKHSQATVETVERGGHIARIIVTCTCGERIEIDCIY